MKMHRLLNDRLAAPEKQELIQVLLRIAAVEGEPSDMQTVTIGKLNRRLGLMN